MLDTIDALFDLPFTAFKKIERGTFFFQNKQEVSFDRDFYAGAYPVTQELYKRIMSVNPSQFKGDKRPVENVTWDDAQSFLEKLNRLTKGKYFDGLSFRLPTEAMWEYCARNQSWDTEGKADMQRHDLGDFSGSQFLNEVGWYDENSHWQTQPVGLKEPNLKGLYDMSGNVFEWCQHLHADESIPDYVNGFEVKKGIKKEVSQVVRGGCWYYGDINCRLLFRSWDYPKDQSNYLGIRLFRY